MKKRNGPGKQPGNCWTRYIEGISDGITIQAPTGKKRPGTSRTSGPTRPPRVRFSLLRRRNLPGRIEVRNGSRVTDRFSFLRRRNVPGLRTACGEAVYQIEFQSPTEKKRPGTSEPFLTKITRTSFSLLRRRNVPGRRLPDLRGAGHHCVSVSYGEETSRDYSGNADQGRKWFQSPTEKKRPGTSPFHSQNRSQPVSVSYGEETSRDQISPVLLDREVKSFQSPTEKKRPGTRRRLQPIPPVPVSVSYGEETSRDAGSRRSTRFARVSVSYGEETSRDLTSSGQGFSLRSFSLIRRRNVPGRGTVQAYLYKRDSVSVSYGEETSRDSCPLRAIARTVTGFSLLRRRNVPGPNDQIVQVREQDHVSVSYGEETSRDTKARDVRGRFVKAFQSPTEKKRPGTSIEAAALGNAAAVSVSYGEETSRDCSRSRPDRARLSRLVSAKVPSGRPDHILYIPERQMKINVRRRPRRFPRSPSLAVRRNTPIAAIRRRPAEVPPLASPVCPSRVAGRPPDCRHPHTMNASGSGRAPRGAPRRWTPSWHG